MSSHFVFVLKIKIKHAFPFLVRMRFLICTWIGETAKHSEIELVHKNTDMQTGTSSHSEIELVHKKTDMQTDTSSHSEITCHRVSPKLQ